MLHNLKTALKYSACMAVMISTGYASEDDDSSLSRRDSFKEFEKFREEQEPEKEQRFSQDDDVDLKDVKKPEDVSKLLDVAKAHEANIDSIWDEWVTSLNKDENGNRVSIYDKNRRKILEDTTDRFVAKYGKDNVSPMVREFKAAFSKEYLEKNFPEFVRPYHNNPGH